MPVGFYWISHKSPSVGTLAAVRLPIEVASFADARDYLDSNAILLKPVAATHGSRICRWAHIVLVDQHLQAHAHSNDAVGRSLPRWRGCVTLSAGDLFLLSTTPDSFDGRYFGVLHRDAVVGQAIPLWTSNP